MPAIEYIITDEDTGKAIGEPQISRSAALLEARRLQNEEGLNVGLRHRHHHGGTSAASTTACPTCGATGSDPCVTAAGNAAAKNHKGRAA
ncbi:MAG: hypothetical protein DWP92_00270 [Armatimonadetes bacterium]|nr:MAG: hypothetical protein DWP92_00270 [Armatimonadota bacterium]